MLRSRRTIMWIYAFFLCFTLSAADPEYSTTEVPSTTERRVPNITISVSQNATMIENGSTPSLTCKLNEKAREISWQREGKNLNTTKVSDSEERYDMKIASKNHTGQYTCVAKLDDEKILNETIDIRVMEPAKIISEEKVRIGLGNSTILTCEIQGYPLSNLSWSKRNDSESIESLEKLTTRTKVNETYFVLTLNLTSVNRKDNGTYECSAQNHKDEIHSSTHLFVISEPLVNINFAKAVGAGRIYLNWTVDDGNEPVTKYTIKHMKNDTTGSWTYYYENIGGNYSSYVLKGLDNNTEYKFTLEATNAIGNSREALYQHWIRTLEEDPEFIPKVSVKGTTSNSLTIGWNSPPPKLQEHVTYYNLKAISHGNRIMETTYSVEPRNIRNIYMFENLEPATHYNVTMVACSEYTEECGNWSAIANGTTMAGVAEAPQNLSVHCGFDNITRTYSLTAKWSPPAKQNGVVIRYTIRGNGLALYYNEMNLPDVDQFDLTEKNTDAKDTHVSYSPMSPNTKYTIHVRGITRPSTAGLEATSNCFMPATVPDLKSLKMSSWTQVEYLGKSLFKLKLPRISERNGPICCYRIFMVKLGPQKTLADLPIPEEITIDSFERVHNSMESGAYVAEMYDSRQLVSEFFLGDGKASNRSVECKKCIGRRPKALNMMPGVDAPVDAKTTSPPTSLNTETSKRRKRREDVAAADKMLPEGQSELGPYEPEDGFLDVNANYTGFIEVIVFGNSKGQLLPAYSPYFNLLSGGLKANEEIEETDPTVIIVMYVSIALLFIIIVLLIALCVLHRHTKHAHQRGEEVITLRNSFRHLCRSLRGRHQLVAASPPDMPPISRTELLQAYIERHRDSDYGFQHEFELLPDRFADRTTRSSEARENLYKNRYPDIKCYDQTRVRLAQMDGICGSDYINANFVLGYKERKKFICAQGPMENTVCDYWRMIWEQHLELVLMLTNLEEYSKTKCAKYWPDKGESKNFGDITVEHVRERPYSDYMIRELKMTRAGERDARTIVQYHFLVWKDFMAPEHPHAILRFVKRVNEAYSLEKGPILVHCSAGVGRTGTLVALDSLLQQLAEEDQVSIFNTVCDLRHQRNFLVQSLKQYIFIYRALMEMAQYGDTEISATQLKAAVEKLRQRDNGKEKCRMEEEYDRISSVLEDRKSFSVGGGDENRIKNRSEMVIPYDRNRVILTPVPGREHSTYINASFIEGYDNSESFIIMQDPLETTIPDFWRMISEQCVSTIVMLSDLSEGPRKCPRYWPDDEAVYDHIRVRYIQSESCPYYTRRELSVVNTKTDENIVVTQYHYHGWPTVEGEVPEVTRGLIELVDQTLVNDGESGGPLVVHCTYGSDRSSMFVALSILVHQLRTERRVDIFTTTKKLRSQRHGMISSFAQYEFLHRAIVNYSDLHNLADEESAS